jgi:hypothetical protein
MTFLIAPSLLLTAGLGSAASAGSSRHSPVDPQLWLPTVVDNGHIDLLSGGKTISVMTDHAQFVSGTQSTRTYSISVTVSVPFLLFSAHVETFPLTLWGNPGQFPGGVDALPPLSEWSWTIYHGTVNDTANWTSYPLVSSAIRTVAWGTTNFTVVGKVSPQITLQIGATSPTGMVAPTVGYVATDILAPSSNASTDTDFLTLAKSLHPGLIRFGLTSIGMNVTWSNATNLPVFRWRAFDAIVNFSKSLPSHVLMSLPVGTWGDGNSLPNGMPVNTSYLMSFYGATGYFPTTAAYALYVAGIVQHAQASGDNITYWSIGNEVPRYTVAEVNEYIQLFNTAAATIHKTFPNALVGSDIMMDPKYIRQFALGTVGTGFLSFHYYPATGICYNGGTYCPPAGGAYGTTNPTIVDGPNSIGHLTLWDAPALAQMIWRNLTGVTLPVIDSETNLNHMGGQYTATGGTDPRIPTIFSASWLATTLLQSVQQNLSSFLYYGFTGPAVQTPTNTSQYGGWGFALTNEGTHDNNTRYAPYWALRLWAMGVPAGAPALSTTGADPQVVQAQAFQVGSQGLSVLVVNRVNTTVHVTINISGASYVPKSLDILGPLSYEEVFNPVTQTESLVRSTIHHAATPQSNPVHLTLKGYSVALLREKLSPGGVPTGSAVPILPLRVAHHPHLRSTGPVPSLYVAGGSSNPRVSTVGTASLSTSVGITATVPTNPTGVRDPSACAVAAVPARRSSAPA